METKLPFGLTTDEESLTLLCDALASALRDHEDAPDRLWEALSREIGLGGATIAEEHGGLGGGAGETWAIMEALGRGPDWTPYLASVVLGAGALRLAGGDLADQLLPQIVSGHVRMALAYLEPDRRNALEPQTTIAVPNEDGYTVNGRKVNAIGLHNADLFIFSASDLQSGTTLFCVGTDHPGVTLTRYATHDGEGAADVSFCDVKLTDANLVGQAGGGLPLLDRLVDEGTAAACAAACGTMRALIERTVDYCKQRTQFGKTLVNFQVLQHRLVDMHIAAEQAASLSQLAFAKLNASASERREAISGAKYLVSEACRAVAQGAVQLHGGIGTTEELVISRYFKRALMLEHLFGGAAYHLDRYRRVQKEATIDKSQPVTIAGKAAE